MPSRAARHRPAWEDRFGAPSLRDLEAGLPKPIGELFQAAREHLRAITGLTEEVSWQGLPWRWTVVYRNGAPDGPAWAYLIPNPTRPQVCIPLVAEGEGALEATRLKKPVREGIMRARPVGTVLWPTWDLTTRSLLSDLLELAALKHEAENARNLRAEPAA